MKIICFLFFLFPLLCEVQCQHQSDTPVKEDFMPLLVDSKAIFQSYSHVAGAEEDLSHDCFRDCSKDTNRKKCFYKFKVEWYVSMGKACYDCPFNLTDCFRPHCVVLDGHERPLITVNRRVPGPSIQVCEGDEIIVDLENDLLSESTTIHWHGMHQYGTPYMDGVPFLTQCPILAGTSFRYHFIAEPAGTHFWHSHIGFQRENGMFGSLIVRSRKDAHSNLYDIDDPNHNIVLTDWFDTLTIQKFLKHYGAGHGNAPYNLLVNGLGRFIPLQKGNQSVFTPLYEFHVKAGSRYRFRSVVVPIQSCPISISIENHTLLLIAFDGHNIEPEEAESVILYGGERVDFIVNANQPPRDYSVICLGFQDCANGHNSNSLLYQIAVLRYEDEAEPSVKSTHYNFQSTAREARKIKIETSQSKNVADFRSHNLIEEPSPYARTPDYKFWLPFDVYTRTNDWFHQKYFYPHGAEESLRLALPQINNISFKLPNVPPLSQPDELNKTMVCNDTSNTDCSSTFCLCTHILNIELGSLVELILVNTGSMNSNHPFHIHGYAFAVVGMEYLGKSTSLQDVKDLDEQGKLKRNFVNPPLKDSVPVPLAGYTVLRFIANNPGYWFFHCHISFHNEVGMGLVLHVGEKKHLPPVPKAFPECRSWVPKPVDDLQSKIDNWFNRSVMSDIPSLFVPFKVPEVVRPKVSYKTQHYLKSGSMNRPASISLIVLLLLIIL